MFSKKLLAILVLLMMITFMVTVSVAAKSTNSTSSNNPARVAAQTTSLVASAQCVGPDLEVTITVGDGPFDVLADSAPPGNAALNDVPVGVYTGPGPGTWTNVRVIEQSTDNETAFLGNFTCEVQTITLTPSWTPTYTGTNTAEPTVTSTPTPTITGSPPTVTPSYTSTGSVIPLPDLYVQMVVAELENSSNCDKGLGYSIWIHNGGNADAGPFNVLINNNLTVSAPGVVAGQTIYLWKEDNIYHASQVLVEADSDNAVAESDESNNIFNEYVPIPTLPAECLWTDTPTEPTATPTIFGTPPSVTPSLTPTGSITPLPDLVVENVRIELENGSNCNSGLGTSVWVHNEGNADAGPFDVLVNSTTVPVAGVNAGQTVYLWTSDYNYIGPETYVEVDSNNVIAESDESNNTFFELLPVPTLPQHCYEESLVVWASCIDENLAVVITSGDNPFDITASGGGNVPIVATNLGTWIINGPDKWDNLTVTETTENMESINLGQFKCRTDERPVPISPAHRSRTINPFPTFSWTGITGANNYRVWVFDDTSPAERTVDIRENSGGPTTMMLTTPLPDERLFWRVRGRQNRVWSLWSVRFTLFKDPVAPVSVNTPVPTIESSQLPVDTSGPNPAPIFPSPSASR